MKRNEERKSKRTERMNSRKMNKDKKEAKNERVKAQEEWITEKRWIKIRKQEE